MERVKFTIITLVLLLMTSVYAIAQTPGKRIIKVPSGVTKKASHPQAITYRAVINDCKGHRYPITMFLTYHNDGTITGNYYYNRKGPNNRIYLSGYINADRDEILTERDVNGQITGRFEFSKSKWGRIGSFRNNKGEDFLVEEDD